MPPPLSDELRGTDRLLYGVIWTLGKGLALLPTPVTQAFCQTLGALTYRFSKRRHAILSAIERCFPERDVAWREKIARTHCSRMFEMFLLILVLPHWSEGTIRRRFQLGKSLQDIIDRHGAHRPILFAIPHSVLMEALTITPLIVSGVPPITTLYRALDVKAAEVYVRRARERWGASFVARRDGLLKAKKVLASSQGVVGILFDQSAGAKGHLTLFFNRVCSTSNLTGLLAAKTGAIPVFLHTDRIGFWSGIIEGRELPVATSPAELVVRLNLALEDHLRHDDENCANWFWAHQRWKGTQRGDEVFAFPTRKNYLQEQLEIMGLDALPRDTRLGIRLDPRPELLPFTHRLLDALRQQRPDCLLWLLVPEVLRAADLPASDRQFLLPTDPAARKAALVEIDAISIDLLLNLDPSPEVGPENRVFHLEFSAGVAAHGSTTRYTRREFVDPAAYAADPVPAWEAILEPVGMPPNLLRPAGG